MLHFESRWGYQKNLKRGVHRVRVWREWCAAVFIAADLSARLALWVTFYGERRALCSETSLRGVCAA